MFTDVIPKHGSKFMFTTIKMFQEPFIALVPSIQKYTYLADMLSQDSSIVIY